MGKVYNPADHPIDLPNGQSIPPHDLIEVEDDDIKDNKSWISDMGLILVKDEPAGKGKG